MSYTCGFCETPLSRQVADLGPSPLANSFLRAEDLARMEPFYPLTVYVCDACLLVQLPVFESPEQIFNEYVYLSSYSDTWLAHARDFVTTVVERLPGPRRLV